jgi:uncharacterized membrane protein YGL010W
MSFFRIFTETVFINSKIIAMLGNRSWNDWISEYSTGHQNPVNRFCHTIGIPMIVISLIVLLASIFLHKLFFWGIGLFVLGWIFQFIGHWFERKPPEFFKDWRFLFVGLRWWFAKIRGKA